MTTNLFDKSITTKRLRQNNNNKENRNLKLFTVIARHTKTVQDNVRILPQYCSPRLGIVEADEMRNIHRIFPRITPNDFGVD